MAAGIRRALALVGLLMATGCRTTAQISEVPRVDLDLGGGNRGYLIGRAPETAALKTTRQVVETNVELPSLYRPKHAGAPVNLEELPLAEMEPGTTSTAATQPGVAFWLLFSYALGLGVPFLVVGAFTAQATSLINRLGKALVYVNAAFGIILVILGVLVFTQTLSLVANLDFVNQIIQNL